MYSALYVSSSQPFEFGQSASSFDFSFLLVLGLFMIVTITVILLCYAIYRSFSRLSHQSNEWLELNRMLHQNSLSREEIFFIKQILKKSHVKHPVKIFEKPEHFERVIEKSLERAGTHKQHLIMSIRQKVFGNNALNHELL